MNLYQLNSEYERIMSDVMEYAEENGGELSVELEHALEGVEIDLETKIENTALMIKNLVAEAEMVRAEEKKLTERRKKLENRSEAISSWLSMNLRGKQFKTGNVAITWRKSESVEVDILAEALPTEFQVVKTTVTADKVELKKALKNGVVIDGVSIHEKQNMQVR